MHIIIFRRGSVQYIATVYLVCFFLRRKDAMMSGGQLYVREVATVCVSVALKVSIYTYTLLNLNLGIINICILCMILAT